MNKINLFEKNNGAALNKSNNKNIDRKHYKVKVVNFDEKKLENCEVSNGDKDLERLKGIAGKLKNQGAYRNISKKTIDIERNLRAIKKRYPNFAEYIDTIINHVLISRLGKRPVKLPPILLDGPPGIGKTAVTQEIARCFNYPFISIDMARAQSGSSMTGSEAFWDNTKTGLIFNAIAIDGAAAAFVQLDELDKVKKNERFSPSAALYGLLEPKTAKTFQDLSFLYATIDLSYSFFVATSNQIELIDKPLLDRLEVYHIKKPTPEHLKLIIKNIYKEKIKELGITKHFNTPLSSNVIEVLLNASNTSIRNMQRALYSGLARAVAQKRYHLVPEDIHLRQTSPKRSIGF